MAIHLRFGAQDLTRLRFAYSPVFETIAAIRLTTPREHPGFHRRWLDAHRAELDALDLRPITLLQPRRGYSPDFLAPPPTGVTDGFGDELARIAATPPALVADEIARSLRDTPGAAATETGRLLLRDPAEVLAMLTELIERAWHALVAPHWRRVRGLLDADVAHQARRLAEGGIDRLLTDLHPTLRWHDNVLTRERGGDEDRDLGGEGVVLMPSAFKWDQVLVVDPPWQPTVIYPARGLGNIWEPARGTGDAALARLLGRTRAGLLTWLTEPATTTTLAHRFALSPGTVSEHLTILREAGLIAGERYRHEVRYRRTALGDAVVRGG